MIDNGEVSLSENAELLVKIIGGIAAAVMNEADVATEETCSRLTSILNNLQQHTNQAIIQQALANLSTEGQNGINMLLNGR